MLQDFDIYNKSLDSLPESRLLITTINAHSYNVSREDAEFKQALLASDVLIPDGISVVWAVKLIDRLKNQEPRIKSQESRAKNQEPRVKSQESRIKSQEPRAKSQESRAKTLKKIAGEDLFYWEMERLEQRAKSKEQRTKNPEPRTKNQEYRANNQESRLEENEKAKAEAKAEVMAKAMFLGSSEVVLAKIKARAAVEFPNVEVHTYSPPYKPEFTDEDNLAMYAAINAVQPDVLFIGMTAPKQEKWAYKMVNDKWLMVNDNEIINNNKLTIDNREKIGDKSINNLALTINNCHVCCIGAVFDFYAGTVERAPKLFIKLGLEWFYRLIKEPRRMWRRYLIGNVKFVGAVVKEMVNG